MSDVIIWTQDNGILAVTHPAENCGLTTEEIAEKDLPDGKPYKIMDSSICLKANHCFCST